MRCNVVIPFIIANLITMTSVHAQSAADCAAEADYASRSSGSTMGSAARGAGAGLLFGAIVGDSSKSAGRGALLGGVVGGVRESSSKEQIYQDAYRRCMSRK
jgi:hypothetical protein